MILLGKFVNCTKIFKCDIKKNFAVYLTIIDRHEILILSLQMISPRQLTRYIYTVKSELLSRLIRFMCYCRERGRVRVWSWREVSVAMEDGIAR